MATVFSVARCVNHIARLSTRLRPRASNSRQAPALALSMASASPPPPGGDGWVLPCKVKSSPYDFIVNELDASGQVLALGDHTEPHVPAKLSAGAVSAAAAAAATSMAWTASTDAAAATLLQHFAPHVASAAAQQAFDRATPLGSAVPASDTLTQHVQACTGALAAGSGPAATTSTPPQDPARLVLSLAGTRVGTDKSVRRDVRQALSVLFPHLEASLGSTAGASGQYAELALTVPRYMPALVEALDPSDVWRLLTFLQCGPHEASAAAGVTIGLPEDREVRKALFKLLRGSFRNIRIGDTRGGGAAGTAEGGGDGADPAPTRRTVHITFMPPRGKAGGHKRPRGGGRGGAPADPSGIASTAWLHCTLQKVGMEQLKVLGDISSRLRGALSDTAGIKDKHGVTTQRVSFRGVTPAQLVQAVGTLRAKVASDGMPHHAQTDGRVAVDTDTLGPGVFTAVTPLEVGAFAVHSRCLEHGELGGNRFTLTLRQAPAPSPRHPMDEDTALQGIPLQDTGLPETCLVGYPADLATSVAPAPPPIAGTASIGELDEGDLQRRMAALASCGFLNVFGQQRVGTGFVTAGFSAPDCGAAVYRMALPQLLHRVMQGRPGLPTAADARLGHQWRSQWAASLPSLAATVREGGPLVGGPTKAEKKFLAGAAKSCPRSCYGQKQVLSALARKVQGWGKGLSDMPHALRLLWMHAYQSLVWNRMARLRWSLAPAGVLEGDLVAVDGEGAGMDAWDMALRPTAGQQGSTPTATAPKWHIHTVTRAEVEAGVFRMEHVVLPLPGYTTLFPHNAVGAAYMQHLWADQTHHMLWPTVAAAMRVGRMTAVQREHLAAAQPEAVQALLGAGVLPPPTAATMAPVVQAAAQAPAAEVVHTSYGDVAVPSAAICRAAELEGEHGGMGAGAGRPEPRCTSYVTPGMALPKWASAAKGSYRHLIVRPRDTAAWVGRVPAVSAVPLPRPDAPPAKAARGEDGAGVEGVTEVAAMVRFSLPPSCYATVLLEALTGGGAHEESDKHTARAGGGDVEDAE